MAWRLSQKPEWLAPLPDSPGPPSAQSAVQSAARVAPAGAPMALEQMALEQMALEQMAAPAGTFDLAARLSAQRLLSATVR
ncbi:MAG TPA: hypothetical protein VF120_11735 [Ktedonobacterales bacterium]